MVDSVLLASESAFNAHVGHHETQMNTWSFSILWFWSIVMALGFSVPLHWSCKFVQSFYSRICASGRDSLYWVQTTIQFRICGRTSVYCLLHATWQRLAVKQRSKGKQCSVQMVRGDTDRGYSSCKKAIKIFQHVKNVCHLLCKHD